MYGIDEDRCDELEYNECEENEYRCQDGSCIPEQYWLDGQYDCSDKSDEQNIDADRIDTYFCPLTSSQFKCDEATAHSDYFACGDGEFLPDKLFREVYCFNYRLIMFFCELTQDTLDNSPKWTLENGACVKEARIPIDSNDMNEDEKCVFYLKCKLIDATSPACNYVIDNFQVLCHNKTIKYPSAPVLSPYAETIYELAELKPKSMPNYVLFNGSIKCLNQQNSAELLFSLSTWYDLQTLYPFDTFFCRKLGTIDIVDPQLYKHCWHDTEQSFLCRESLRCISKHRLQNEILDCKYNEDEYDGEECYMKKQYRLNCSYHCLFVSEIGNDVPQCHDGSDEYLTQLKWKLSDHKCREHNSVECNVLKAYIQSPSSVSTAENNKALQFRHYCDTLWQLPKGFDESRCSEWNVQEMNINV